ncbi:hypothetical protein GGI07_000079 [Coemansia sp. Benny D115]|nr:hypothetical protein GGI07_000079 [Coemansia sp. Benny D115]
MVLRGNVSERKPYFRVKRGMLTLFVNTESQWTIEELKQQVVTMLLEHDDSKEFQGLEQDQIKLMASDANNQYRALDETSTIGASDLTDDQILYFVLMKSNGSWEIPDTVSYDVTDSQDTDMAYA